MKRLENNLVEGVTYIYDEITKKINWLKMVPSDCLYINQERKDKLEKSLNKKFEDIQINEVKDADLILNLQGIRYLLDLRGYKYCKIKVDVANPEYAAATCEICFIPNEEENFEQVYTACASAHFGNTRIWYKNYLIEAASNRSLCRTVRNYLKIGVVSSEEISGNNEDETAPNNSISPLVIFESLLKDKGISFERVLDRLKKENYTEIDKIKQISDIPKSKMLDLIEKLKKVKSVTEN